MRSSQRTSPHRARGAAVRAGVLATGLFLLGAPSSVLGQQLGEGMKRTGTVGITNEEERRLFNSLICTCGCPRETLGTCTCDFAHARRAELRALLEEGKSIEAIQALFAQRYGSHALAVPPNEGGSRALWAVPVVAIAAGAGGVLLVLRKWRRKGKGSPTGPGGDAGGGAGDGAGKTGKRDAMDDRLDRELEDLER